MEETDSSEGVIASPFVRYLEGECGAAELDRHYRIVQGYLFVDECVHKETITLYQRWQKLVTGADTEKSFEKVQRRMFGSEMEDVAYVLDGKRCLIGRRAPGVEVEANTTSIKVAHAGLLSAKDYIHPRDPLLESIEQARVEMDKHKGLIFILGTAENRLEVSIRVVQSVVERMRSTSALRKRFPAAQGLLRDALEPALGVIVKAKSPGNSERILAPVDIVSLPALRFLRSGYFYFAISGGGVVSCFNIHPKSISSFLHEQFALLKSSSKLPAGLEQASKNRAHLAKIKIQGRGIILGVTSFSMFIDEMQKSKKFSERLPKYFSLLDVLNRMIPVLKSSKTVSELEVLQTLGRRPHRDATYRLSGPWIFVIEDKSVITKAILLPGKENEKMKQRPKPKKRRRRRRSSKGGATASKQTSQP